MIPWSRISTRTAYEIKYIHIHKDGNDYSCTCRPLPFRQAPIETGHDNSLRWKQLDECQGTKSHL